MLFLLVMSHASPVTAQESADLATGFGRIKGTVSGPDGQRVVAARVVARVALEDRDVIYLTTTDDTGTYYFETLPGGVFEVEARVAGLTLGHYDDVKIRPPFRTILDFRLTLELNDPPPQETPAVTAGAEAAEVTETVMVHGLVLAEDEKPLPDAEIAFSGGPPPGRRMALSTEDGRVTVPDLPVASYLLSITAPGTIPIRIPEVKVTAGRPLELQIGLVDFPVEMAARRGVILPREAPLAPRRLLAIPLRQVDSPPPPDPPSEAEASPDSSSPPPPEPAGD
jgi:hypothetical protein